MISTFVGVIVLKQGLSIIMSLGMELFAPM